ncbi:hypothetical protein EDB86DRAFT_2828820 [Lactarius hatsudake]|nr:hypothetical protein EDB86DRAFT_2828820 [Lactarius hatsudake]
MPLQPPITWGQGYLCASGDMIMVRPWRGQTNNGDGNDFMALATLLCLFCGQVLVWVEGAHCTWSYLAAPTNLVVSLLLSSSPAPTHTTRSFGSHPLPHPPLLVWYHRATPGLSPAFYQALALVPSPRAKMTV